MALYAPPMGAGQIVHIAVAAFSRFYRFAFGG